MQKLIKNKNLLIIILYIFIILFSIFFISQKIKINNSINNQNEQIEEFIETQKQEEDIQEEVVVEEQVIKEVEQYIGVLEINKINLKQGFYKIDSSLNNVNKHIQILKDSDYPNSENGNTIIAGHSGNSRVAFFNALPNLELYDEAKIYYENNVYTYQLIKSYEIEKTGKATIYRNPNIRTLTLITCKHNTNKQLVYIFEEKH